MATPQQLDHLRKLKALADRPGTEAEGRTARSLLAKKMRQFGATEAQLMLPTQKQQKSYRTPPNDKSQRSKNTDWGHEQPEAIYGDLEARRQQAKAEWQRQHEERWEQRTRSTLGDFQYHRPTAPKTRSTPLRNRAGQGYDIGTITTVAIILFLLFLITQSI